MTRERYTSYPRPVLWLVPEGELPFGGRRVEIAPFYLSTLPVTNVQLEAFTGARERPYAAPGDDDPAIGVTLEIARGYCEWYARIARKAIRLPSEAEWEHACRAGSDSRYFWGDDEREADAWAWHRGNSGESVPALAAKRSNGFGLFAMLGGVWEWVEGEEGGLLRGGSWRTPLAEIRCDVRQAVAVGEVIADAGFRIARSLRG
ncbi:MAG TPA: SUMF1/EgtB/PvdO family nonheme iron enzyme [Thermoanaerobaculia bacterium]|nr:SUMF1/EgtB/PvdO family nonheme iron enzyme [Thermoanaerobaculia bacterium]